MGSAASPESARNPDRSDRVPARLAFVTSTPMSVAGGSGTYVGIQQLARSLEERTIRVEVHAPTSWSPSLTATRILFNLLAAPRLRRGGYDWVVGFDLDGFAYGRAKTAPYVASIKGVIADELQNERGMVRALLSIQAAFERLAVHRADVVIATSRYSRDRILTAYGVPAAKVRIVPEPIDLGAWARPGGEALDRPRHPPAILTVAHMYPRKNLGVLLRAYAHLRDAGIAFEGWVVGDGPCRPAWERLRDALRLRDRVAFLGTIPRRDLQGRYRRAALFCLPSRQEGFGIVFLEAMASGTPIVAARMAAIPEVVADGEVGLLVDPDDPQELARTLAWLLGDPSRRRAMGEAGRRRVERYGADRVAVSFLATVQAALDGRSEARLDGQPSAAAVGLSDRGTRGPVPAGGEP